MWKLYFPITVLRLFTTFVYQEVRSWGWFTLIHTWCFICGHRWCSNISRINGSLVWLQTARRHNGQNSSEMLLQRCIIYSVASTTSASIDERLERQIEERRRKKKGVANDCVTGERERLHLQNFTYNIHWDKCSWFLCLTVKTGSGRPGLYNVQLTVENNNNFKKLYMRAAVNSCIVIDCMMCTFRDMKTYHP